MKFLRSLFKHSKLIIATCVVMTGVLGFFIKDLNIDNSLRQFLPHKDASYSRLMDTEEQFGSMIVIGVSLEEPGKTFLTPENIQVVKNITDRVLELDEVEGVDSLTHIDYVCNQDGSISATQLIPETYTGSREDMDLLRARLTEWSDMYNRVVINDDFTASQMQITIHALSEEDKANEIANAKAEGRKPVTDAERQQNILNQIRKIVQEECEGTPVQYKLFGDPVVLENSRTFMLSDLTRLIPLVIVVVLLSLYFSFKTLDGTLLPLITVVMATAQTMGLMALLKITFTLVSSVIPVALIAVGSAYGIHVLTHYYVALGEKNEDITREQYENAVFSGLKEVWKAVLLAGITTVVGFISLVSSPIEPLHSFAVFTAVGVALSLLLAVTFIPALLLSKKVEKINANNRRHEAMKEKIKEKLEKARRYRGGKEVHEASGDTLYKIYHFFCGTKPRLVVSMLVIVIASIIGLRLLHIDTALINYFPANCDMRNDINYVDEQFAGTNSVYFTISGENAGDMKNPEILKAVDDMQQYLAQNYKGIGKIVSYTDFIKRINQVWHDPSAPADSASSDESSGDELSSFGGWEDDSFGFGFDDEEEISSFGSDDSDPAADFVDPNDNYRELLSRNMTTEQVLDMLNKAYAKAGGKYATVEKMLDVLEKEYNFNGMAYYEIPYDVEKYPVVSREELSGVIDGYLTLLSGSLGRFLDDEMNPKTMRVTCQLRNHSTEETGNIIAAAKDYAAKHFPEGYTIEATGAGEMEYTMTKMIVSSQLTSLLISLLSVFIIISVSFSSAWAGLLGAVPLALTILLNYMVMGLTGINLDLVTSIIASVAVGVGIDYTIHFLTTYKEERALSDDLEFVTRNTFTKSGHGIITNAIAVGLGFLVLCLSKFVVLRYIGILVAIVMFTSSVLAMTIIPGFLNAFDPRFIRPKSGQATNKN